MRNQLMLELLPFLIYAAWGLMFQGRVGPLKVISLPPHIQRFLNLADGLKNPQVQALGSNRTARISMVYARAGV